MAYKIFEINSSSEIYSATAVDKVNLLEKRISELYINRRKLRSEFRNSSQTRNKSRSRSRKHFNPNGKYCYFHFMFGNKCYPNKCKSSCSWNKASEKLGKAVDLVESYSDTEFKDCRNYRLFVTNKNTFSC
ncbi:uncharacterized protein TNCV_912111 [Trichonephila clavipes]|nr:uncharacterized protein TNCV_912111 [Trichonephila clavipes]